MDGNAAASSLAALRPPRWLLPALAVAIGYYLAARLGMALTLHPYPISTLWPPNALLLAALLLAPGRDWWWLLAAALPAHIAAELQSGVPGAMVLGWYASNCSEALIGASLLRVFVRGVPRLDSLREAGVLLLSAALAAPVLSSFIDAALVRLIGGATSDYWGLVKTRLFSNALAELMVVPLIVAWAAWLASGAPRMRGARNAEAAVLFGGLLVVCLLAFAMPHGDAHTAPAVFYAPLPFLLWAAVRFGPQGLASALPVMAVATIWGTVHGLGPFAMGAPQDTAREMQLFLITAAVPSLLLAVALAERARIERESRSQLTHLSRVAMLGELSGGIAHELNQPLTAILSNAQAAQHFLAKKPAEPGILSEILQDIILADQRAGDVIERLRAMFKRGETRFEPIDANRLVRDVMTLAHGDLTTRGIEVALRLAPSLPEVKGDRIQLQQVMLNLVVNAADAMSACASQDRLLTVQTLATRRGVHINVIDRGPGFTVPQEALFQAFYTTKPQGLGLGLSISKSIITAHGGRLWAATRKAGGATFLITLPALPRKH
jgi:signal transduction histidine kinase